VVVAGSAFWSNILHVENYDYNTFVKELQQIGEYVSKQKIIKMTSEIEQLPLATLSSRMRVMNICDGLMLLR
jgi:hypothetical protein